MVYVSCAQDGSPSRRGISLVESEVIAVVLFDRKKLTKIFDKFLAAVASITDSAFNILR